MNVHLLSHSLHTLSLTFCLSGAVSLQLVGLQQGDASAILLLGGLYVAMLLAGATRWLPLVCVLSIVVHVAYLSYFGALELQVRLNDITQQNPLCSPYCVADNSLTNGSNWAALRGSVMVCALQIAGSTSLLCLWPDEEYAAAKEKLD
jgi:hypothetical protein